MKTYPLFKVHVNSEGAVSHIRDVFRSGYINEGAQVTRLTRELNSLLETKKLTLLNSCTSALTVALRLSGVTCFDDVVSTPMTCVATNTPIVTENAYIVWADIDPTNGMVTPKSIDAAITNKTKAVMVVAWAGNPPDLEGIKDVCQKRGVKFILDAAHAFEARYKNKPIHEWADYTCYSFQAIKHFTTGDGGALACSNIEDFQRAKSLKWFGLDRDRAKDEKGDWKGQQWDVDITEAGYKFNMNNLAAAIGISQLPHIPEIMRKHRENAQHYDAIFGAWNEDSFVTVNRRVEGAESSHWVYAMQLGNKCVTGRDSLLKALNAEGIMAGVVHVPNDDYTCFQQFRTDLPGVRKFAEKHFSLPCGWWLNDDDIAHIASRVKELAK